MFCVGPGCRIEARVLLGAKRQESGFERPGHGLRLHDEEEGGKRGKGKDGNRKWAIADSCVHIARNRWTFFVTSEAAITEAQHGLDNHSVGVRALRRLVTRMEVVPISGTNPSRHAV